MLLDERTHVEAPPEPPKPRNCSNCGADLADVQEWCLECGQRQPHRGRWSAGLAALVVGGVIALAGGGSALSYVALRDDATDQSSKILAQAPPPGAPLPGGGETGPATGGTPGATPPASTTPSATTTTPTTTPKAPPLIHVQIHPSPTAPTVPVVPGTQPGGTTTPGTTTTPSTGTTSKPRRVKIVPKRPADSNQRYAKGYSPTNAVDFDPLGDGHEHPTEVRNAIDRNLGTSWSTLSYPQGLPHPLGLFVDAGSQVNVRAMEIATTTPGFSVSIYGSTTYPGSAPPGNGWQLVAQGTVGSAQSAIGLGGQGAAKFEYYLVWITSLPAGRDRATISEITLHGPDAP